VSICRPALWLPSYGQGFARSAAEAAYPNLRNGLRFCWHGPLGPTGLQAFDVSGHANHGALTNMDPATDWVPTSKGWGLDFDGAGNQHVYSDASVPDYPFTLVAWFDSTAAGTEIVFSIGDSSGTFYTGLHTAGATAIGVLRYQGTVRTNTYTVTAGVHLLVAVCTAKDHADVYIDGVLVATVTTDTGAATTWDRTAIGVSADSTPYGYSRAILLLAATYRRALLPGEIRLLYTDPHAIVRPVQRTGLSAPGVGGPYRTLIAETFHTGAATGEPFAAGAAAGESFNTGTTAGQIDGRCG